MTTTKPVEVSPYDAACALMTATIEKAYQANYPPAVIDKLLEAKQAMAREHAHGEAA